MWRLGQNPLWHPKLNALCEPGQPRPCSICAFYLSTQLNHQQPVFLTRFQPSNTYSTSINNFFRLPPSLHSPSLSLFISFSFSLKHEFLISPLTLGPPLPFALAPIPRLVSLNTPFCGLRCWSHFPTCDGFLSLSLSHNFRNRVFGFHCSIQFPSSIQLFSVASYSGNYLSFSPFLVFCSVENLDLLNLYIIKIKIRIIKKVIIKVLDYDHNSSHFFTNILWNYWHVLSQLCSQKETQSFIKTSSLKINNSIKCIFSLILFLSLLWLLIL